MNLYLAMFAGFVAASLTDWLFMGVLFHERYITFPEVWRDTSDERQRIVVAQAFAVLTAVGFVLLASMLLLTTLRATLLLAIAIWIIGPLPLLLGNHLFIKLDPRVTFSHAAGWLAKLLLIGAITAALL
jgi:intracellular septation protein A